MSNSTPNPITTEEVEQAAKAIKYENMSVYKTIKNGLDKYTVYDTNGELRGTFDSKIDAICFKHFFSIYHDAKGASTGLAVYVHWKCLQASIINLHRELARHFRKVSRQDEPKAEPSQEPNPQPNTTKP